MKVLIYGNRKQDDTLYDISTPEKESAAYLAVFKELDGYWQVYDDAKTVTSNDYKDAKNGDGQAAKRLMTKRRGYEYENFTIAEVVDPLTLI